MNNNRNFGMYKSERHFALDDEFPERGMEPGPRCEGLGADFERFDTEGADLMRWFYVGVAIVAALLFAVHFTARFFSI